MIQPTTNDTFPKLILNGGIGLAVGLLPVVFTRSPRFLLTTSLTSFSFALGVTFRDCQGILKDHKRRPVEKIVKTTQDKEDDVVEEEEEESADQDTRNSEEKRKEEKENVKEAHD